METVLLKQLPLSVRAKNVLENMGLFSVEEFMRTPLDVIASQRNIGEKTILELQKIREQITRGEFGFGLASCETEEEVKEEKPSYSAEDLREMARHSIKELRLSNRSYVSLKREGILFMDQLVTLSEEELSDVRNLGEKSREEVVAEMQRWLEQNGFEGMRKGFEDEIKCSEEEKAYFQKIAAALEPLTCVSWKDLRRYAEVFDRETLVRGGWELVFRLPLLAPKMSFAMRRLMKEDVLGRTAFLDRCRTAAPLLDAEMWLKFGLESELLEEHRGFYLLKRDRVSEILASRNDDSRETEMLQMRLHGRSLREVGDTFSVTRERVRQVILREMSFFPPLFEDYFAPLFESFQWTRSQLSRIFPELGEAGTEYLFQRYKTGKKSLSDPSAAEYSGVWRERLMEFLQSEEIRKDQESASRTDLLLRTLRNRSDVSLSYEELEEAYYDYLANGGFPTEELQLNARAATNQLRTVPNVVFDREGKIRYCPVREDLIWECIDFQAYKNTVLSAERIYRDYPELMVELDIRDGYELFYVLKWSLPSCPSDLFEIRCRRVPVIVMGEGSEEEQALKLLRELAPIEQHDFYAAYEEVYGVRRETAQANPVIFNAVAPYFINGLYRVDAVFIDAEDAALLSGVLRKKELWWSEEVEELFARICVRSPKEAFNSAAFRELGYIMNSGYLFPEKYLTAARFFEERYLSDNVLDLSALENKLLHLPAFHSLLVRKKKELDFVEVSPKLLFSIQRVEALYGLTKSHLTELQEWLSRRFPKYFNGYSLWEEVQIHPYVQRLQENKWMLTCIMRQKEEVISLPVAGSIILSLDKTSLRISKICKWLVELHGVMPLEELERRFNDTFGSRIQRETFLEKLREMDIERKANIEDATDLSVISDISDDEESETLTEIPSAPKLLIASDEKEEERTEREEAVEPRFLTEIKKENSFISDEEREVLLGIRSGSEPPEGNEDEVNIQGGEEMREYEPLQESLMLSGLNVIRMSFSEMEEILGFELPPSARKYPAWWSNGEQVHSEVWMDAGYKVNGVDFINGEVCFVRDSSLPTRPMAVSDEQEKSVELRAVDNVVPIRTEREPKPIRSFADSAEDVREQEAEVSRPSPVLVPTELSGKKMTVDGHDFYFIQTLVPEREFSGKVKRYYPEDSYENKDDLSLLEVGEGPFCRFSVQAGAWTGVYLWVADGEILYIGETLNLANRFNIGYGHISPRNCYAGGQSTNCRMNKVVLDYFEKGKIIALFFCPTAEYKELEAELLAKRHPRFNLKENTSEKDE